MYNKLIVIGNLTRDPEQRHLNDGTPMTIFTIAVNSKLKRDGESKDDVLFIEAVTFGKLAENCAQYLSKGSKCLAEGRLKENKWEKEGQKHSKLQIIAGEVRFLSPAKTESSGQGRTQDTHSEPF